MTLQPCAMSMRQWLPFPGSPCFVRAWCHPDGHVAMNSWGDFVNGIHFRWIWGFFSPFCGCYLGHFLKLTCWHNRTFWSSRHLSLIGCNPNFCLAAGAPDFNTLRKCHIRCLTAKKETDLRPSSWDSSIIWIPIAVSQTSSDTGMITQVFVAQVTRQAIASFWCSTVT